MAFILKFGEIGRREPVGAATELVGVFVQLNVGSGSLQVFAVVLASSSVADADSRRPPLTAHSTSLSTPLTRARPALTNTVMYVGPRMGNCASFQSSMNTAPLNRTRWPNQVVFQPNS